ncbi:YcaO-like family protein [Sedimentitalea sp. XS_ASV28]|uniref:YcaO-like family protein n=1 Tax=Sedimentitalea sp. XS_ASV28 TaxID=3241296 RepID=UPI0035132292
MVERNTITRPEFVCLSSDLRVFAAPGGGAFLVSETGSQHSASPLVSAVLACADGTREAAQIVAELPNFPAAQILFALSRLRAQGIVEIRSEARPCASDANWASRQIGPVNLVSDNRAALSIMCDVLAAGSLVDVAPVSLILCSDYLAPIVTQAVERGRPCLPVKLVGPRSYFGPHFDDGPCLPCLRRRLRLNRPIETWAASQSLVEIARPVAEHLPPSPMAMETARAVYAYLRDPEPALQHVVELGTEGRHDHETVCICACSASDSMDLRDETPVRRSLGGYRGRSAEDVVRSLRPLVSDLTGLVSSAGPLDTRAAAGTGDTTRHVWAASYPIVPRSSSPDADAFHGVALGKGLTGAQAEASVLCEAVERMSAQFPDGYPTRRATLDTIGADAVHPNSLWQFSAAQFRDRDKWNALSGDDRRHVPVPLAPDRELDWVQVWSVTEDRAKWMPRELCFANAPEPRYGRFDPNGCAAGSTRVEAALQAFLELVERDSIAIWWYNRIPRPGLDPLSVADARVRTLAQGFLDQGWDCWLLDVTADLHIPCLAAVARARSDGRWCIGFGCHFESAIAIERAMTELVQLFRANGRDGPPPWDTGAAGDDAFLFPRGEAVLKDAPVGDLATLGALFDWSVKRLAEHGIETLILDQTRPETGLPVVKIFAPGLRHFWPRFGPGRLYDVPVQMGWRARALSEDDLNPAHLFL